MPWVVAASCCSLCSAYALSLAALPAVISFAIAASRPASSSPWPIVGTVEFDQPIT